VYDFGEAFFALGDRRGTSKVVFGPANVTPLLGALTLESLGLMVNPVTREVSAMRLFLASSRAPLTGSRCAPWRSGASPNGKCKFLEARSFQRKCVVRQARFS
jgi:hypothetical protein